MEQRFGSLIQRIIVGSILTVSWIAPAVAQETLTRAEVYKLLNQVQLLPKDQSPRPAKTADVLVPLDQLQTKTRSQAELLFNEGSLARIGSSTTFRFKPGLRRFELRGGGFKAETIFELRNGTALILTPSDSTGTTIETPENRIDVVASLSPDQKVLPPNDTNAAVVVAYNSITKTGQVFNLTNLPVKVWNFNSTEFKILKAGETVTITNGIIGPIQTFDLQRFYQTSQLAAGLGPGQEALVSQESANVQLVLNKVRKETLAGLETQRVWIEGLCNLNSRGGASTLSTNCITTNSDDPIRSFEDNRNVVNPPRREEPQPPATTQPQPPVTTQRQAPTGSVALPQQP